MELSQTCVGATLVPAPTNPPKQPRGAQGGV